MAKCVRCGRGGMGVLHQAIKLNDKNMICFKCYKELGGSPYKDMTKAPYLYSWNDIKDGFEAMHIRATAEAFAGELEEYKVRGMAYDNEEGQNIQSLVSEFVKEEYGDDKLSTAEIKEELEYEDRVYVYPTMDASIKLEPTEYDGEPAVKVYCETSYAVYDHIGWIPKESVSHVIDIINNHDYEVTGEFVGGPFKYYDEDDKLCSDKTDYGCRVYLKYRV